MINQLEIFEDQSHVQPTKETLSSAGPKQRGAVFTRREIIDFILDLSGYVATKPLYRYSILEPSFGHGDFLIAIIERLVASFQRDLGSSPYSDHDVQCLFRAIRAVELHGESYLEVCKNLQKLLVGFGFTNIQSESLINRWLVQGDFLFTKFDQEDFSFIVGNPPYLRQEMIPSPLLRAYRSRFATMYDRADLYIPFYERSLELLKDNGKLGFICADRWIKNKYGGPLRKIISNSYHLQYYVQVSEGDAFQSDVSAYPAVTIISKSESGKTRISRINGNLKELGKLAALLREEKNNVVVDQVDLSHLGSSPWIMSSDERIQLVRDLEDRFPLIEDSGCKIGIGVATGADAVYIGDYENLEVEPSRKLKLARTHDIVNGIVEWQGKGVVNPFLDDGSLVDLNKFPKLSRYFDLHSSRIKKRNIAKRNANAWYRTIDKISPTLAATPKLLIPDIKGDAHIVYEKGELYPHHNLYFVVSKEWDLHILRAVLLSGLARLFVTTYTTLMRGGYLRFQAQYLRRIRLPRWNEIPVSSQKALITAAKDFSVNDFSNAFADVIGLSDRQKSVMERTLK